jgi:hypothetical protein
MRIFSDHSYLASDQRHVVMLYPFWGKNAENPRMPTSGRYDHYEQHGGELFEMTSLAQAEVAVLPAPWEDVRENADRRALASEFVALASRAGKPVLVFFWHDSAEEVCIPNSILFRTSLYQSRRKANEFAMPSWSEDFIERYLGGRLVERRKQDKPVVGFCGAAGPLEPPLRTQLKHLAKRVANAAGLGQHDVSRELRARAMAFLKQSPLTETNFVIRNGFWAGVAPAGTEVDYGRLQSARIDYVTNMVNSDYVLCLRGGGNFSYRLYETLSCGRIPVFVNTDCSLPYDQVINYKDYCVWVEEDELPRIGEKVAAFHEGLTPAAFIELQHACRRLWETSLSPFGFFSMLETCITVKS